MTVLVVLPAGQVQRGRFLRGREDILASPFQSIYQLMEALAQLNDDLLFKLYILFLKQLNVYAQCH